MCERWRASGAEVHEIPAQTSASGNNNEDEGIDLHEVLLELGSRGILQLMVEGGGSLFGSFLKTQRAQQLRLYVGSCALGSNARRWVQAPLTTTIADTVRWQLLQVERVGNDICVDYLL